MWASNYGKKEVVELLLSREANVGKTRWVRYASTCSYTMIVVAQSQKRDGHLMQLLCGYVVCVVLSVDKGRERGRARDGE